MSQEESTRQGFEIPARLSALLRRPRLVAFAATLIVVGLALGGLDPEPEDAPATAVTEVRDLALPAPAGEPLVDLASARTAPAAMAATADVAADWTRVTVRPGQSLDAIFRQLGYSPQDLHAILALNGDTSNLRRIRPGDEFAFLPDARGGFAQMRYTLDDMRYLVVERTDETFAASVLERASETRDFETVGTIRTSFWEAGRAAGLSPAKIMELAHIFGWDIDFILDIRGGDRFSVVYEKVYREGEYLRDGNILAASFTNQGERFQAIRFETENGGEYFNPEGRNMRKSFLRAPLEFTRVSSNFNPRRFHPVLKRVRPHNGIDYAAPPGTPVVAAGNGKVIRSAYNGANGHHVFIEHAGSIVTKYLHFSKRAVREGQRVKQGDVIGYVGATGLASGPHLHYEFLVNGVHRNPRTVPLPKAEPLEGHQLAAFRQQAAPLLNRLSRMDADTLLAASE